MNMKNPMGYEINDVLELLGLQRRSSMLRFVLPAVGLLALGAGMGVATGVLLAPSSGRRLRRDMGDRLDQMRGRVKGEVNAVTQS